MRKLLWATIGLFFATLCANADELVINPDVPSKYVVVKGDTLWDISEMFLRDPWKWSEIWQINEQIENPHLIYPGDIIALIWDGDRPILTKVNPQQTLNNGVTTVVSDSTQVGVLPSGSKASVANNGDLVLVPTAKVTPLDQAIPTIPREHIAAFLAKNRITNKKDFQAAPYIVAGRDGRLVLGGGDEVYVKGDSWNQGTDNYQIFRDGKTYYDPKTGENLGYEIIALGDGQLKTFDEEVAKIDILKANQNLAIGDRLLPTNEETISYEFQPAIPDSGVDGEILSVVGGVSSIGQYNVVAINLGSQNGIVEGHVFSAFQKGGKVKDPYSLGSVKLPEEEAGTLMVFKTFERVSYGLVLKATRPMLVGDVIRSPL